MCYCLGVGGDLKKSAKAFKEVVWPEINHWFGGGILTPVEDVTQSEDRKSVV